MPQDRVPGRPLMDSIPDFNLQVEKVRWRIAFVAASEEDHDHKESLRRVCLAGDVTLYTQLYCMSERTLLDVSTNDISMEEVFNEHTSNASVAWEFNVANGTNVRLRAGETIVCLGEDEYVAMKLTDDGVVTYRDAESSLQLLNQVNGLLEARIRDAQR